MSRRRGLCDFCNESSTLTLTKTYETKEDMWGMTNPVYKNLCKKCVSGLKEKQ